MADLHAVIAAAGWDGHVDVSETDDGHVHVRWNGRHVEAVSEEAAALFIEHDAKARRQAECPHVEWYTMNPPKCTACGKVGT